jgi:hypothetical protein
VSDGLSASDIVGDWRLLEWVSEGADDVELPMGERPEGILVYSPTGTMCSTFGRSGRPPIDGDDMQGGPAEQRLEAMGSFIAYSGSFRVDGGDVLHEVEVSLFPNWVGSTQRRHVALEAGGDRLVLTSDPFVVRGRLGVQKLTWERIRR